MARQEREKAGVICGHCGGAYFGRAWRLFRKSTALISEEQGAYSGRALRLSRKSKALIPEERAVSGTAVCIQT